MFYKSVIIRKNRIFPYFENKVKIMMMVMMMMMMMIIIIIIIIIIITLCHMSAISESSISWQIEISTHYGEYFAVTS